MLARKFRLSAATLFKNAQTYSTPLFLVKSQKNQLDNSRFGFIISKKISKKATERNRLKRVVRSIIEDKYLGEKGKDILFILRNGIKEASREEIEKAIANVMI